MQEAITATFNSAQDVGPSNRLSFSKADRSYWIQAKFLSSHWKEKVYSKTEATYCLKAKPERAFIRKPSQPKLGAFRNRALDRTNRCITGDSWERI